MLEPRAFLAKLQGTKLTVGGGGLPTTLLKYPSAPREQNISEEDEAGGSMELVHALIHFESFKGTLAEDVFHVSFVAYLNTTLC